MKTKEILADVFRELVMEVPFHKISIKMITDRAGLIRPTFYNYFQDKYEVIEYLFEKDVSSRINVMLDSGMETEAIKLMFICFEKHRKYYAHLFEVSGQNCFEDFFRKYVEETFLCILEKHPMKELPSDLISPDTLARFNSLVLTEILKMWLSRTPAVPADEMFETYVLALGTSVFDMIDRK